MAESSEVAKIKEYKGLLDEGIISQEEFEENIRERVARLRKE